jgi:hypothetical protein
VKRESEKKRELKEEGRVGERRENLEKNEEMKEKGRRMEKKGKEKERERHELSGLGEMHKYQKIHNGKRCITEKEVHNRKVHNKKEKSETHLQ